MRTTWLSVALVLLAVALAVPAAAQQTSPEIRITASTTAVGLHHNKTETTFTYTVTNAGTLGGEARLSAASLEGWTFDLEDTSFSLAAGASRTLNMRVEAGEAARNGTLKVTGTLTEANTGRTSPSATSDVQLTYLAAPAAAVPPPPPPGAPWGLIAAAGGVLLLGLLVLSAGSVKLELSSPRLEVTPAGSGYVRVTVTNRWWPARRVHVRVRDVPPPAVAALSLARVRLRRGESVSVPLLVKAPVEMPDGTQSLSVQARAGFLGPWVSRRRVKLTFRSPVAPGAPLETLAPVILQN